MLKNTPSILGDKSFQEYAHGKAQSLDIEIDKKGLKHPVDLLKIVAAVANSYNLSVKDVCVAKRGNGVKNIPAVDCDEIVPGSGWCKINRNSESV